MRFDGDWPIVALDLVILTDWALLALWFRQNTNRVPALNIIAAAFTLIFVAQIINAAGDVFIALDYKPTDIWILYRPVRALTWRMGSAIGFTTIVLVLRYGKFNER